MDAVILLLQRPAGEGDGAIGIFVQTSRADDEPRRPQARSNRLVLNTAAEP